MHITKVDSGTGLRAGLQIFPIGRRGLISYYQNKNKKRMSRNPLPGVTSLETTLHAPLTTEATIRILFFNTLDAASLQLKKCFSFVFYPLKIAKIIANLITKITI